MRPTTWLRWLPIVGLSTLVSAADDNLRNLTIVHEAGRCAFRGDCGKNSIFGGELPCADNGLAHEPSDDLRDSLVAVCGEEWKERDVCCEQSQVDTLKANFNKVQPLIYMQLSSNAK